MALLTLFVSLVLHYNLDMSNYLGTYGAGEAQRERNIKRVILSIVGAVVLVGLVMLVFRNFGEKRALSAFLDNLKRSDYQAGYRQFGCTEAKPCRDYVYDKFLEDWGPKSTHRDLSQVDTEAIRSCKTGVIRGVTFPSGEMIPMMIQREDKTIGFAPYPYSDLTRKPERGVAEQIRWWLGDLFYSC